MLVSSTDSARPDDAPDRDPHLDTAWSPKLTYPVVISLLGLIGVGTGVISLATGGVSFAGVLLVLFGVLLLAIGIDQFRRTPRLQLLPDGLIYYSLRGRTFIERELVHEVRLLRGRRRGVAALIRIEYLRDHEDARRQRAAEGPVDGELLMLSRTEIGGDLYDVADVLERAGYRVVDGTH